MELTDYHIDLIEKALGFKLYAYQINVLKGIDNYIPSARRAGKTLTYMLVDLTNISKFDEPIKIGSRNRNENWYKTELLGLRKSLIEQGIPCREIEVLN